MGSLGGRALLGAGGERVPQGTVLGSPAVGAARQHLLKFIGNAKSVGTSHSARGQSCHQWDRARLEEGTSGDTTRTKAKSCPGQAEPLAAMQLEPTSTVGGSSAWGHEEGAVPGHVWSWGRVVPCP